MNPYESVDALLTALGEHFVALGRVESARNELHNLKFNGDILSYVSTFRNLYLILNSVMTP